MKKYKFTILLLLTFVIAFPVITVKLVTAEQEKKARQEELAQVTGTEKSRRKQLPERKKTAQIKPVQDRQILIVQKIQKIKQVSRIMKRWQIRSRREPLQQRISAIFPMPYLLEIPEQ